jgi:hypothetical protein
MVRAVAAVGVLLAGAAAASAQGLTPVTRTVTPQVPSAGPFAVPGVPVGQSVQRVGETFTPVGVPAGQPAGRPIGFIGPGGMPVTTAPPPGKVVDLSNLAAPLVAPLPPGLDPPGEKSILAKLHEKWLATLGLSKPKEDLSTDWTPGISRRNRARHRLPWIWD